MGGGAEVGKKGVYVSIYVSEQGIDSSTAYPDMMTYNLHDSKVGRERCRRKLASGCLLGGCSLRDSSTYAFTCDEFED